MSGRSSLAGQERPAVLQRNSAAGAISTRSTLSSERCVNVENAPQRLDLDVEQLNANGPLGGRAEDVEQAAALRELAPLLNLVDPLVAHLDERRAHSSRSSKSPLASANERGRSSGSGTFSDSAGAETTSTGAPAPPAPPGASSASSAAIRSPTRCGGGARCDS